MGYSCTGEVEATGERVSTASGGRSSCNDQCIINMYSYGNDLLTTISTKFLGKIPCSPVNNCPLSQSSPIRDINIIKEPSLKDNSSDDTRK